MKVKELIGILESVDDHLEVFAFDKKVESWGIKNVEQEDNISPQFFLQGFLNDIKKQESKNTNYIAVTEIENKPLHVKPKELTKEDLDNITLLGSIFNSIDPTPKPIFPQYMAISMSEETFKFIESISNVFIPIFGEKEYKINNLTFKIYTEEDHEKQFGKLQE